MEMLGSFGLLETEESDEEYSSSWIPAIASVAATSRATSVGTR
jgi:hypothetical protein